MSNMIEGKGQFSWVLKIARIAMIAAMVLIGLVIITSVAMVVTAAIEAIDTGLWRPLVRRTLLFVAALAATLWLCVFYAIIQVIVSNEAGVSDSAGRLERIETLLANQTRSIKKLIDLESLSDQAKSLIYRDQEIEALRETIHEDMTRQDYETAQGMIEALEKRFGYVDEASRLREELAAARKATLDERIDAAVGRVHQIIASHDWPRAIRAAQRLLNLFPDSEKAASLPGRVEAERTRHKRQLLQAYGGAVRKNDVDGSIELLKELDRHLTPQEAAALEEAAGGVFRAKLHNLGVQFAIHVTDQRWADAVATGEEIVLDYPNSRMSHEVRQKMPQLRAHAAEEAAAAK